MPKPKMTLEDLQEALAADVLDPEYPIEWVKEELREAGLDPEKIAESGRRAAQEHLKPRDSD